jgi:CDP-4-dehydro-6-deoxyglucose reductase, E3
MERRITVQPSGHSFWAEENDSILQAGLKAGYAMPYGCSNGTCGLCRARLIEGEVTTVKHSDFPFNEVEKSKGYLLTCACAVVSSGVVLDVAEAGSVDDIEQQEITVRVKSTALVAEDLLTVRVQTPRSQRFRFLAGQSTQLSLKRDGEMVASRTLPIASCPCDDRNLEFHVGRQSDDQLYEELAGRHGKVKELMLVGPTGDFVLPHAPDRRYVFIAEDTGFAPVRSLIEHAMSLDEDAHMQLIWQATTPAGHYLENLCRAWADALDHFSYSLLDEAEVDEIVGQVSEGDGASLNRNVFVAGSEGFVSTLEDRLLHAGLDETQLHLNRIS